MRAIRIASTNGHPIQINPLHLVTWAQAGEYGTVYTLSTDSEDAAFNKTPTPAADITDQFNAAFDGVTIP